MDGTNHDVVVIDPDDAAIPTQPAMPATTFLGLVHLAVERMDELQLALFEDITLTACAAFLPAPERAPDGSQARSGSFADENEKK